MGIRENIRNEIARLGYGTNLTKFCREKGLSTVYLNQLLNGKRRYNEDLLNKIAKALGIPIYQLFIDEPVVPKSQADKEPAIVEIFPDQETQSEFAKFSSRDDFLPIRILADAASLGHGAIVSQERTGGYALIYRSALPRKALKQKRTAEKIVCLFATGDSMSPTIQDKSLVAIDVEDKVEIRNKRIYAIEIPDEGVTIKRILQHNDHLLLFADNRDFPGYPRALCLKELNYNPICGRVVWTWNKLD
ncbi:MAG: XRE family transcriptional regulator [Acidobacteriota bacterium]